MTSICFENSFEFTYADVVTFGRARTDFKVGMPADILVYGVPFDTTSTRPGARFGPRGIREQSVWFRELWNPSGPAMICVDDDEPRFMKLDLFDLGDCAVYPGDILRTSDSIRSASRFAATNAFPVMLGGEHYCMFPAYQGVADHHDGKRIGIFQVDAHNDLVDDDPVFGKHWTASPMRRSLEFAGLSGACLVQFGLHGYMGAEERTFQRTNKVNVFSMKNIRHRGLKRSLTDAIDAIKVHCDLIYVTLDIDSVDPAFAPGSSTPMPGGFTSSEFLEIASHLGTVHEVVALDIVEVAPTLDPTSSTALLAAYALNEFIFSRFSRRP